MPVPRPLTPWTLHPSHALGVTTLLFRLVASTRAVLYNTWSLPSSYQG
jgi:hypothetical protein